MEEKTLPKLLVSRAEAEKKIQERIDKGQQLLNLPIRSENEFNRVESDSQNWSQFNGTLLAKLFDNSSIMDQYDSDCVASIYMLSPFFSLNDEISSYQEAMVLRIDSLKGICDQLELFDEPTNTPLHLSDSIGTNIFIGHGRSQDWRMLKDFISDKLKLPWDEFNRIPVAGTTNIARLAEMLDHACMAFLVMTAEDEQTDGTLHARENVIHEAGLFQGKLGFERAIILLEEGCQEFSNIHGLGQIRFPKGNIRAAFEDIREVLERESIIA